MVKSALNYTPPSADVREEISQNYYNANTVAQNNPNNIEAQNEKWAAYAHYLSSLLGGQQTHFAKGYEAQVETTNNLIEQIQATPVGSDVSLALLDELNTSLYQEYQQLYYLTAYQRYGAMSDFVNSEEGHDLLNQANKNGENYYQLYSGAVPISKVAEASTRVNELNIALRDAYNPRVVPPPPDPSLGSAVMYTVPSGSYTYDLNFDTNFGNGGKANTSFNEENIEITDNDEGLSFEIPNMEHPKYGKGKYVSREPISFKDGQPNRFEVSFQTNKGNLEGRWKVEVRRSKTPVKVQSRQPARTTKTAMRGAYAAPFGLQGVKGIGGRAKNMGPYSDDPFAGGGKVDPSRWKENQYDAEFEDEEEKEEINESRGKKVIKLRERDLYRIVEKVIREKRNTKRNIKEYWMQDVSKEIKKDHTGGSFRKWCESHNYGDGCSDECIREALKTDDKLLHFRAGLAKAFCHSNHDHQYESRRPRRTLQEKKGWIGAAYKDAKDGKLTQYCGGKVTCGCVEKALKSDKMKAGANLYLNTNSKRCRSIQKRRKAKKDD